MQSRVESGALRMVFKRALLIAWIGRLGLLRSSFWGLGMWRSLFISWRTWGRRSWKMARYVLLFEVQMHVNHDLSVPVCRERCGGQGYLSCNI